MSASQGLFIAGSLVYVVAGGTHGVGTLFDTVRPTIFAPTRTGLREEMEKSTIGLRLMAPGNREDRPSVWRLWLGFNLSHSLGIVALGALFLLLGARDFGFVTESGYVLPLATAVSVALLLISVRFWFYLPTAFVVVPAAGCFISSYVLA